MEKDKIVRQTKIVRNGRGRRVMAEINPRTGEPQVFPFTEADSWVLANTPDTDVATSVRDHREAYRAGHTTACRGDLSRGLCH